MVFYALFYQLRLLHMNMIQTYFVLQEFYPRSFADGYFSISSQSHFFSLLRSSSQNNMHICHSNQGMAKLFLSILYFPLMLNVVDRPLHLFYVRRFVLFGLIAFVSFPVFATRKKARSFRFTGDTAANSLRSPHKRSRRSPNLRFPPLLGEINLLRFKLHVLRHVGRFISLPALCLRRSHIRIRRVQEHHFRSCIRLYMGIDVGGHI